MVYDDKKRIGRLCGLLETLTERIFLMRDLAAVEEAVGLGAQIVEGEVAF